MNTRQVVRRIQAWHEGKPLPRGETRHFIIAEDADLLIVCFLRMGGESRPWAIAYGRPDQKPKTLTVVEARNRDQVADMSAAFAPALLSHLRAPGWVAVDPAAETDLYPLRQVWVPNAAHLEMFHHLAYAYTFTTWGAGARGRLNAFGRACSFVFREAQRPAQQIAMAATDALRQAYTFPAEDIRQGHLGFLLALLQTRGGRERRLEAAIEAERTAMSTSLDPDVERDVLEPALERHRDATRAGNEQLAVKEAKLIEKELTAQLETRWQLTADAIALLRSDKRKPNGGLPRFEAASARQQWWDYARAERIHAGIDEGTPYTPSVETDRSPVAAARRFLTFEASQLLVDQLLLHDDRELQAEAVAAGDAIRGEIIDVRDIGPGKKTIPIWRILDPADRQLRLRTGSHVCLCGQPKRTGVIRSFDEDDVGRLIVEIEINGWLRERPEFSPPLSWKAADPRWKGQQVTIVPSMRDDMPRKKRGRLSDSGPGTWLTHRYPGGPTASPENDDRPDDVDASELAAIGDDL